MSRGGESSGSQGQNTCIREKGEGNLCRKHREHTRKELNILRTAEGKERWKGGKKVGKKRLLRPRTMFYAVPFEFRRDLKRSKDGRCEKDV